MRLELDKLHKPVSRLRKTLKTLPQDPSVADVHNLRIQIRRCEAIVAAFMPGREKLPRHLLKTLRPLRKSAGRVRDLDVLVRNAVSLARHRQHDSLLYLLEHLGKMRTNCARKLVEKVANNRDSALHDLKLFSLKIEKKLKEKTVREPGGNPDNRKAAMKLVKEFSRWPTLSEDNLHSFRIRVKQLRYALQLTRDPDVKFVTVLGQVKNKIGDWHDWQHLTTIAHRLLNPERDQAMLGEIEKIGEKKFNRALAAAQAIQAGHLRSWLQAESRENSRSLPRPAFTIAEKIRGRQPLPSSQPT
jgi:CHAD domain-containing protein